MLDKRTLGEQKEAACEWCEKLFLKKRYDQKFCSPPCGKYAKKNVHRIWLDRPDREKQNALRKERYRANHEHELLTQKEYRQANPDKVKEVARAEYRRNKERHTVRTKAYRAAHPEVRRTEYQNARQKRPWGLALTNARHRSLKKGFAFELTREWCEQKWTGRCAVSDLPFSFGTQTHFPFSPSIDRIDSSLGYIPSNCRFVLFAINSFKGSGTDESVLHMAQAIVAFQKAGAPIL